MMQKHRIFYRWDHCKKSSDKKILKIKLIFLLLNDKRKKSPLLEFLIEACAAIQQKMKDQKNDS